MIIPYRVKNPPRNFPVCTVALIGLNVFLFAITSDSFLVVKESIVDAFALRWGESSPSTILTAMFLHGDIFHLLGNMLFLWVFGPAVEDRLHIPGYIGLYLLTGFAGTVAHVTLGAAGGQGIPTLGASGCIMGVLGAYWYLFPWSKVCLAYFFWLWIRVWYGVLEVAAVWVVGAYFALDLFYGCLYKAADVGGGVANFAHVGGALTGALLLWMLCVKRDSEQVSNARASHAELKDIDLLSVNELKELLTANPEDEELLVKYARKAMVSDTVHDVKYALTVNRRAVIAHCPMVIVHHLLVKNGTPEDFSASELLYLAQWCEQDGTPEQALRICAMIQSLHPDCPELEMAYLRAARVHWNVRSDSKRALAILDALLEKFPAGQTMFEAEDLRDHILHATGQARPEAA